MANVLSQLLEELNSGRLKVVDLTSPLGPDTPVINLPAIFAPSPGLTVYEISRYDSRGPAWYWNALYMGEHTGTHFDAPIHWVTGKDLPNNATDTIPASRFICPACVKLKWPAEIRQIRVRGDRCPKRGILFRRAILIEQILPPLPPTGAGPGLAPQE